jgi:uncharacterized protein YdeI (YjbR/CyaY-like superfamily)
MAQSGEYQKFEKRKMEGTKSEEVSDYISSAPPFARPILNRIRKAFHFGCPELEETMKWGAPFFEYKGLLGGMGSFREHVTLTFWKGQVMSDPEGLFDEVGKSQMASIRFRALKEMPAQQVLISYVEEAAALNEKGVKAPKTPAKKKKELDVPEDLKKALARKKKARETFENFSYSHRKEYIEWITEAKREETRKKRVATTVEWLSEGKPRNWKYVKKK